MVLSVGGKLMKKFICPACGKEWHSAGRQLKTCYMCGCKLVEVKIVKDNQSKAS